MRRPVLLALSVLIGLGVAIAPTTAATNPPTVMLVIDASGSMKGERVTAARSAASAAVAAMPADVRVGLAQFASDARTLVPPTTDHVAVQREIASLTPGGTTVLYDSVAQTVSELESGSALVILSDGADSTSAATLDDAITAANRAGIAVNIVGVMLKPDQQDEMLQLTNATGGTLENVENIASLIPTYQNTVAALESPLTPPTPSTLGERVQLALVIGAVMFVALAFFVMAAISWRRTHRVTRERSRVLAEYGNTALAAPSVPDRQSTLLTGLSAKLDRAGLEITAVRWVWLWVGVGVVVAIVMFVLSRSIPFSMLLAFVVGIFTPLLVVRARIAKRIASFGDDLPEFFQETASALRSGMSFAQSLESVVSDGDSELRRQIRRALAEMHMGATIDVALMRVADRMDSTDMRWAVTALAIQRDVGGNLAQILETAAKTINERAQIDREVRTLSAEGRLSAVILISLPIGLFAFLFLTRREYIEVFWTTMIGWLLLAIVGILMLIGWVWMRRTMRIEV